MVLAHFGLPMHSKGFRSTSLSILPDVNIKCIFYFTTKSCITYESSHWLFLLSALAKVYLLTRLGSCGWLAATWQCVGLLGLAFTLGLAHPLMLFS